MQMRPDHLVATGQVARPTGTETLRDAVSQRLNKLVGALRDAGIRSTRELRVASRRPESLERFGLAKTEIGFIVDFGRLSRIFPGHIALGLLGVGITQFSDLAQLDDDEFASLLKKAGVDPGTAAIEGERFRALHGLLKSGHDPRSISGVLIDLDPNEAIDYKALEALQTEGIETLEDWATQRGKVRLNPGMERRLDAYARLKPLGLRGESAGRLIDAQLDSALALARLSSPAARRIAARVKIDPAKLDDAVDRARQQTTAAASLLDRTMIATQADLPEWLVRILGTLPFNVCVPCQEENSAFSKFAYYVYLVQRTGQRIDELEDVPDLDVNLKELSPLADTQMQPDPLASCSQISLLCLIIRQLQEHLDQLYREAGTAAEREGYSYVRYESWRSDRMAHYYPELRALWQDDVLTSEQVDETRGSILLQRQERRHAIREQLRRVDRALKAAKVTHQPSAVSDATFDSLGDFVDEPYYRQFVGGVQAIEQILQCDDLVQEAVAALDQDQPGESLSKLYRALAQLDQLISDVMPVNSVWRNPQTQAPFDYSDLIRLGAAERRQHLQQAYDDLMSGRKLIYKVKDDVSLDGLRDNGQIDVNHEAWDASSDFSNSSDGITISGSQYGDAGNLRRVRYTRGDDLEDYSVGFDVVLAEGGRIDPNQGTGIEILARTSTDGTAYRLAVRRKPYFVGDDARGVIDDLVLERIDPGGAVVELDRDQIGVDGQLDIEYATIRPGHRYRLTLEVNGPAIHGRLYINSARTVSVGKDDTKFNVGSFSIGVSETFPCAIEGFEVVGGAAQGLPPFYAPNRQLTSDHLPDMSIDDGVYQRHVIDGHGMSQQLMPSPFTSVAPSNVKTELLGVERGGNPLFMVFKAGNLEVDNQSLDYALERGLAALFFMRYAMIPVRMAQAYLQSGDYERAIELLRLVYDETAPGSDAERQIYPMLADPPDALARGTSPDERLMQLRIADASLQWAEWLFRRNTSESRHRARRLYERVVDLHGGNCNCDSRVGTVVEEIVDRWLEFGVDRPEIDPLDDPARFEGWFEELFDKDAQVADLLKKWRERLPIDPPEFLPAVRGLLKDVDQEVQEYNEAVGKSIRYEDTFRRGDELLREAELQTAAHNAFDPVAQALLASESHKASLGISRSYFGRFGSNGDTLVGRRVEWVYGTFHYPAFCVPANPLRTEQKSTACLMLDLLNRCRNILGFSDDLIPPLRFEVLLSIARGFAEKALAAERDLLNFRQQFEQETFGLIQAQTNLAQSEAELGLEALNVDLAKGEFRLAELQLVQVDSARAHYAALVDEGLSDWERFALGAAFAQTVFSGLSAAGGIVSAVSTAAGIASSATGNPAGIAMAGTGIAQNLAGGADGLARFSSSLSSFASMQASFERREQQWMFSEKQSEFGVQIAQANVQLAAQRTATAQRRASIAGLRRDLAADAVHFLNNKFLNQAMYVWLLRTIRDQYRARLNFAISTAFLAERALAFELQNRQLDVIRLDYFNPKRDGLLGATQLQTDLDSLEHTRLRLTQRKLQLSKTISLAQLMPREFEEFKQTGVLRFSTAVQNLEGAGLPDQADAPHSLDLFDRDFPGHYMRLIKSVQVTVVALTPPHAGIRATLRNSGLSRVVIGPPYTEQNGAEAGHREISVRRTPESVALSAPFQASGLFELNHEDPVLLPFEGSGVASDWNFELPKAANQFDYRTISDVLVTIKYTALEGDDGYRNKVISRLDNRLHADQPFSVRRHFPDAWYDLHHPELVQPPGQPMTVQLQTTRADFPPNVEQLSIERVTLYVVRKAGADFEVDVSHLQLATPAAGTVTGGSATSTLGVISAGQGNAASWSVFQGKSPAGTWELALAESDELNEHFARGDVEDILIVLTVSGALPSWPAAT